MVRAVGGGILVDYGGIRGYIPMSQLESSMSKQLDRLSGRKVSVKVVEVDKETNRLVFSQRAVAEAEVFEKQKDLLNSLKLIFPFKTPNCVAGSSTRVIGLDFDNLRIE